MSLVKRILFILVIQYLATCVVYAAMGTGEPFLFAQNAWSHASNALSEYDINDYEFNHHAFGLEPLVNGRPLVVALYKIFTSDSGLKILNDTNISIDTILRYVDEAEKNYPLNILTHSKYYHTNIHALDAVTTSYYLLEQTAWYRDLIQFDSGDKLITLMAAVSLRMQHNGLNNAFFAAKGLTDTVIERSIDMMRQILANASCDCDWATPLSAYIGENALGEVENTLTYEYIDEFATITADLEAFLNATLYGNEPILPLIKNDCGASRIELLPNCDESLLFRSTAVMWGDIGNMGKSYQNYLPWLWRVQEEFFRLGDAQRASNITVSTYNDRYNPDIGAGQAAWGLYVVKSFIELLEEFMPELSFSVANVDENIALWSHDPTLLTVNNILTVASGDVSFINIWRFIDMISDFEIEILISAKYGQLQDSVWVGDNETGYLLFLDVSRGRLYKLENNNIVAIGEIAGRPYGITLDSEGNGYVALQDSQGIAKIDIETGEIIDEIYKVNGLRFGGPYSIHYFNDYLYLSDIALAAVNPQNGINGIWGVSASNFNNENVESLITSEYGYSGITNDVSGNVFSVNLLGVLNERFSPNNPTLEWDFGNMQYEETDASLNNALTYDTSNIDESVIDDGTIIADIEFDNWGNLWQCYYNDIRGGKVDGVRIAISNAEHGDIGVISINTNNYGLLTSINLGKDHFMYLTFADNLLNGGDGYLARIRLNPVTNMTTTSGATNSTTTTQEADDANQIIVRPLYVLLVFYLSICY